MVLSIVILVFLGLVGGSFVSALVWRLHKQSPVTSHQSPVKNSADSPKLETDDWRLVTNSSYSIFHGRSMCTNCGHALRARDLVPLLSWLSLRGHCHYCRAPISVQYPLIEASAAVVFLASYYFWPTSITGGQTILFVAWLLAAIGLLALLIYDARWMLLPSKIIYPTLVVAVIGRAVYLFGYQPDKPHAVGQWALALLVSSGLFWLLFTTSRGRYIGYGDVRLGLIIGTLLATPGKSLLVLFLASVLGLVFALPSVFKKRRNLSSQVPFGPFLIVATAVALLFGDSLINWYTALWG